MNLKFKYIYFYLLQKKIMKNETFVDVNFKNFSLNNLLINIFIYTYIYIYIYIYKQVCG